jgi:hypothetical protein
LADSSKLNATGGYPKLNRAITEGDHNHGGSSALISSTSRACFLTDNPDSYRLYHMLEDSGHGINFCAPLCDLLALFVFQDSTGNLHGKHQV